MKYLIILEIGKGSDPAFAHAFTLGSHKLKAHLKFYQGNSGAPTSDAEGRHSETTETRKETILPCGLYIPCEPGRRGSDRCFGSMAA